MNKIILIGRLTRDPELRYTSATQKAVCHFTLAVDRINKAEGTDFFSIEAWNKQAENCEKFLSKGSKACVEGRGEFEKYEKDGKTIERFKVKADRVEFIGSKEDRPESFEDIKEALPF